MTESEIIRYNYCGVCPDCNEPIPEDVCDGASCSNCFHAFFVNCSEDLFVSTAPPDSVDVDTIEDLF